METRLEEQLGAALQAAQFTLCTAESCTGGLIAHRMTDIPGSSEYVLGGIVAYANQIKQRLLHVQEQTLIDYGAVSEQTAGEMAVGSQQAFQADFAVSVTGIAGPGGGTVAKPVGLTYIGLAGKEGVLKVERHVWQGDREANKKASAEAAMRLALEYIGSLRK
jgi:PncC family amidohydrolase